MAAKITKCTDCGTTEDRLDNEYGAVFVPVTLNDAGKCEGCAYKQKALHIARQRYPEFYQTKTSK